MSFAADGWNLINVSHNTILALLQVLFREIFWEFWGISLADTVGSSFGIRFGWSPLFLGQTYFYKWCILNYCYSYIWRLSQYHCWGKEYLVCKHGPNVNLVRVVLLNFLLQFLLISKWLISQIDIILESEGELPLGEVSLGYWRQKRNLINSK